MDKLKEFESFVAGIFLSSSEGREPMTLEDATITLLEWDAEGIEYPDGLIPLMYATIWNRMLKEETV